MIKSNPCKVCGSVWHTAMYHKPRKPIKVYKSIESYRAPLKRKIPTALEPNQKQVKHARLKLESNSERSKLMKEADRVFSRYIRKSNSINGYSRCVTCGILDKWQDMDCGHFISRRKMSVRYDIQNCHTQCIKCNRELGGNPKKYRIYILMKYQQEGLEELYKRANSTKKMRITDFLEIIERYKDYS